MDAARWQAVESAFDTVMALDESERERWLRACEQEDPALAGEVRALLSASDTPGALDRLAPQLGSLHQLIADVESSGSPASLDVPLPTHIGPYVVAREIGRGGMGIVCQAHDPRLGRDVAIKVFPHALGAAATEQRVLAEARAASALDHPNICTIYDIGTLDDGRPYLAMAYYPGGTLAERITSGPVPAPEAARIALQVAEALACAHDAGIVHRDVKPRNVAFGDRGEAKLLDFGVALLRDQSEAPGSAGTPAYMAPEQVRGETLDGRADVWALGVMLFEMLTGQRPFRGQDRHQVTRSILHDDPPDVQSLAAAVPAALADLVRRALHKSPNERPASAAEVADALRAMLAPVGAESGSAARLHTRGRMTVVAIAAAVLLGAVFMRDAWRERGGRLPAAGDVDSDPSVQDLVDRAREREMSGGPQGTEEAIRLLHEVLSRDSTYAPAHALLARAYARSVADGMSRQGASTLVDSAETHARRAIALAPTSPLGYAALGFVHASMVNYADAVPQYLRALELDPRHPQTMMDLARSYMALDRFDEAVTWQERALALDPQLPGARVLAIGRYTVWELFDHAWRHIDVGLRLVPTDVEMQSQAMLLDLLADDTVSARRRFDAIQPLLTPVVRARLGIAFELAVNNPAGARAHADRIAGTGSSSQDFITFGLVYRAAGDRARGDSLVRLRIDALHAEDRRTGRKSTQIAAALAHAHSVLGNRDSAVAEFARWEALGGVASRRRMQREPGWQTLRSDPRWEPIIARMDARFQAGREMMRVRLAREFPRDTSARARQVPLR